MSILENSQLNWSKPISLKAYRLCPKEPGLYVIGEPRHPATPITQAKGYDSYLGRWPENFRGLYVGISLSQGEGIRGRLRAHARGRGCSGLQTFLAAKAELHFIFLVGFGATNFESVFVHIRQRELFSLNRRDELKRFARRLSAAQDAWIRAAGHQPFNYFSIPDYFEDG